MRFTNLLKSIILEAQEKIDFLIDTYAKSKKKKDKEWFKRRRKPLIKPNRVEKSKKDYNRKREKKVEE